MTKFYSNVLLLLLFSAGIHLKVMGCPVPGTYSIGPTGNYTSITSAVADLNSCPSLTGAYIFEFQSSYNSSVETFPVAIPYFTGASSTNNITFRPQSGTTNITITSANTTGTLLLNGAGYINFDGRAGGVGATSNLVIENTNAGASYALQFINDAGYNTVRYCKIKSANNSTASGTVIFSTAGAGAGNDNNTISNSDIFNAAGGTPVNAVYQSGSASPNDNSGNNILNNNIYNFFSATTDMNGILLANNASGWIISGNSFYQTTSRNLTGIGNNFSAIQSAAASVTGLTISGNNIGGTAAAAAGTALTITGSGRFNGILLTTGTTSATEVQGNTIKNISLTTSADGRNSLINIVSGKFNVGSVATPNVLGSQSSTGSIVVSLSSSTAAPDNPSFEGISAGTGGCDVVNITANTIGGITAGGTSTTAYILGIYFTGSTGNFNVDKNIVGSTTTANSFVSSLNSILMGIFGYVSTPSTTQFISSNKVVNLTASSSSVNNRYFYGILAQGSAIYNTVSNEIYNLSTASASNANSVIGLYLYATVTPGQKVTGNKIYSLSNTSSSGNTSLIGIYYFGPTSGSNTVEGNFVHSLSLSTSNATAYIYGIYISSGATVYKNNMIRLGLKPDGTSLVVGYFLNGIFETSGSSGNSFYHNSIYLGGTCSATSSKSYAFYSTYTGGTARTISNNIFFNARSSSAGVARHYAYYIKSLTGLTSDYNDIVATGSDKMFASYNGTDYNLLSAWRTATGKDANTVSSNPQYIAPAAAAASVNLHINSAAYTVVEGGGTLVASVTDDYDGQARASYTPTDIGADAISNAVATRIDVGATALSSPAVSSCYSNAAAIKISIKNYGGTLIDFSTTPVTVSVAVTGIVTQNLTGTLNTGTLAAGSSTDVTMSATLNMTTAGTYTFNATIQSVANTGVDADITNDAMTAATRTSSGGGVTWLGVNTSWNDASNWCGGIPDASTNITIPNLGVGANYPVVNAGVSGTVNNISIATNATVTVNNNGSLAISGVITNNGGIVDNGEIILNGTASTNFPGNGSINVINNLTVNKTAGIVTFNKAFQVNGVFTPTAGNILLDNVITLRSTDDSTARVGQSGAVFTYGDSGSFEVQRYIPARRAWRLLTAPLSATGDINSNWQNDGLYSAGKGTLITGTAADPNTNGLDISPQNNPSLKSWNVSSQSLVPVANTLSTDLSNNTNPSGAVNTGYFIFIRGDRNPSNTAVPNTNNTTLSSRGYLQTGTQIFNAAPSSGNPSVHRYTLIGNPYASPIDFNQLVKTNLLDKFYVWDPIPADAGCYVTLTKSGGTYIAVPDRVGGPNQYIQSGQAFYVETDVNTGITPTLTVQETHKVSNNNLTVFRPLAKEAQPEGMRINLYRLNAADNSTLLADGVYALFDQAYDAAVKTEDAAKLANINETFGLARNNNVLVIEKRPLITETDTLFLQLIRATKRDYRMEFKPGQLNHNNLAAFLEDKFLNTSTALNMNSNTLVDFSITGDVLSAAKDRFRVVFRPSVVYTNVRALINNDDVDIEWNLPAEINISKYVVERSSDNSSFTAVGEVSSSGNSDSGVQYKLTDISPVPGEYYYRIKSVSKNDVIGYSNTVNVKMVKTGRGMYVYPNPVKGSSINLQLSDIPSGLYSIRLVNQLGQPVLSQKIFHHGGTASKRLTTGKALQPGYYQLEIKGASGKATILKVMVQ
ncbi:MAG: hypothetical protein QM791_10430 [Ferruginibacter sp.]